MFQGNDCVSTTRWVMNRLLGVVIHSIDLYLIALTDTQWTNLILYEKVHQESNNEIMRLNPVR